MLVKSLLTFSSTFLLLESVVAWTIDLPEARKYYFEKNIKSKKNEIENDEIIVDKPYYYFDNINSDSPLNKNHEDLGKDENKKVIDEDAYAGGYEYQGYMEKKVTDIVHKGSSYLEGLNKAIRQYDETLKNCSRFNRTDEGRNSSWLPENENPFNITMSELDCDQATKRSEYVRRLASLALWATRELQDLSYNEKYHGPGHEPEQEENELILRLAWFLDRLAQLTGFEPNGQPDVTTERPTTTLPPPKPPSIQQPPRPGDAGSRQNCRPTSNGEQCLYPATPDEIRRIFGDPSTFAQQTSFNSGSGVSGPKTDLPNPNELSAMFTNNGQVPRNIKKRSLNDDPLLHVMKYYVKHKVWASSNPTDGHNNDEYDSEAFIDHNNMDTKRNNVKTMRKRSVSNKKGKIHLPQDPYQDLSNHLKHKSGINYVKNPEQIEKIRAYMEKIRDSSSFTAKTNVKKLEKTLRSLKKRSVERSAYYSKKEQPRVSEDPQQDISYYVKNKRGTNYVMNLADSVQLRAGLQQVFQTGNIEVVRRYGSNYNPANPNPLLSGAADSTIDT